MEVARSGPSFAVAVAHATDAGVARRKVVTVATSLGFAEIDRSRLALVVTELASNIVRHARSGVILISSVERGGIAGIEVLALDKGPGMSDIERCLTDGYSTAGTPGTGLGAVMRMSDSHDISSAPGVGTALLARIWSKPLPPVREPAGFEAGAVCVAQAGEEVSGDACAVELRAGGVLLVLVADGIGHGPLAHQASTEAVAAFRKSRAGGPAATLEVLHGALRGTRGAAASIAEIAPQEGVVRYAGIGNVAGSIVAPDGAKSMASQPGTLGYEVRKIREFTYPWRPGAALVMHSDGLATHWRIDRYPGLLGKDPSLIAGVLYRDFTRGRDDAAALVVRGPRA